MVNVLADVGCWSLFFGSVIHKGLYFLIGPQLFAIPGQDLRVFEKHTNTMAVEGPQ